MRLSYRLKLTLTITFLAVFLTSICMFLYYRHTHDIMISSLNKNLRDVAKLGNTLFDDEAVAAIKRLKKALNTEVNLSQDDLEAISEGEMRNSLSQDTIDKLHSSDDFQFLMRKLVTIGLSSLHDTNVNVDNYDPERIFEYLNKGVIGPYLLIAPKVKIDVSIAQTLVSPAYKPINNFWPGNPIGNTYSTSIPISELSKTDVYISNKLYTDAYYTALVASSLIKDTDGNTVAMLGLDYPPGREFNKLKELRSMSYALILLSFFLGSALSYIVSKRMSYSVRKLYDAATEIKNHNYNIDINIKNTDEFGLLATSFNQMADAIYKTTSELESSNERLRSITADMHDGVGSILTSIQIVSNNNNLNNMDSIRTLAKQGLNEVRFLMDALEYQNSDTEILTDGIELLAIDILKPKNIHWQINEPNNSIDIPFQMYLDVQRMCREIFTNIIKHSDADECSIEIELIEDNIVLNITDNGKELDEKLVESGGHGINNLRYRASKYLGELTAARDDLGFHYSITLKISK